MNEKIEHIQQATKHISDKDTDIQDRKEQYDLLKQKIFRLLLAKYHRYLERVVFEQMLYHTQIAKRKKRLSTYSKNYMYRRRMRLLFGSWRGVTHTWFKERINRESVEYEIK